MINNLFLKPTTLVILTLEKNWSIYRPLDTGQKYYVFFRVRLSASSNSGMDPHCLDLYVESAYERDQSIKVISRFPFGKVAERTAKGVRI